MLDYLNGTMCLEINSFLYIFLNVFLGFPAKDINTVLVFFFLYTQDIFVFPFLTDYVILYPLDIAVLLEHIQSGDTWYVN